MTDYIVCTMLSLLLVQFVAFFASVAYLMSHRQGGHQSCQWKSSIMGGIGFVVMCLNGFIVAAYVDSGEALKTRLLAASLGLIGIFLLGWGRYKRSHPEDNV